MIAPFCPVALPVFALEFPQDRSDLLLVASGPSLRLHLVPSGEMLVEHEALWGGAKIHGIRPGSVQPDGSLEVLLYGNKKVELLVLCGLPPAPSPQPMTPRQIRVASLWAHQARDLVLDAQILAPSDPSEHGGRSVLIGLAHNMVEEIPLPWGYMGSAQALQLYGASAEVSAHCLTRNRLLRQLSKHASERSKSFYSLRAQQRKFFGRLALPIYQ